MDEKVCARHHVRTVEKLCQDCGDKFRYCPECIEDNPATATNYCATCWKERKKK